MVIICEVSIYIKLEGGDILIYSQTRDKTARIEQLLISRILNRAAPVEFTTKMTVLKCVHF